MADFPADGYVKYRLVFREGPPPQHPGLAELESLRRRLCRVRLIGQLPDGVGYGNLSLRTAGGETFIISGTATGGRDRLAPEQYALVTAVDISANCVHCTGRIAASSETMTHAAAYRAAPSVGCVVHIHDHVFWLRLLAAGYPRTPVDAAYGTPLIAEAAGRAVAALPAGEGVVVLAGHEDGIIAVGRSIAGAARALLAACRRVR
jgi:hypothetical protein